MKSLFKKKHCHVTNCVHMTSKPYGTILLVIIQLHTVKYSATRLVVRESYTVKCKQFLSGSREFAFFKEMASRAAPG